MAMFRYRAMTQGGALVADRLYAANLADLEARLQRLGLDLIDGSPERRRLRLGRIPRRALINFCFHLQQIAEAGIPIVEGLKDLRDGGASERFRPVLAAMVESVEGGKRLSEAMANHRRVFDGIAVSLVRAGEESGTLPAVLAQLVESLKWQDELAAQIRRLALYPAILLAVTLALLLFVMIDLVPKLTSFMKGMDRELPWHTELLIGVSNLVAGHWPLLLGMPFGLALASVVAVRRSRRAALLWHSAKLRLPLLGGVFRKIIMARFATVLAMLYRAGIPVLDALRATEPVVGNAAVARALRRAGAAITTGAGIAAAFEGAGLFPPLVVRMLRIGENTGSLDRALDNVGYFFNRDVRESAERLEAVIEPLVIVVVGAVVGWVMLSVLGPIYDAIARMDS
ncbi:MAG TPA: type II secretion system F family protein [Rhodocyclaceae bacterium]